MVLLQIFVGSFWLIIGTALLTREYLVWTTVENIDWFKKRYGGSSTQRWERFCRDTGLVSLLVASLLFITLPYGVGVLSVVLFVPSILLMR